MGYCTWETRRRGTSVLCSWGRSKRGRARGEAEGFGEWRRRGWRRASSRTAGVEPLLTGADAAPWEPPSEAPSEPWYGKHDRDLARRTRGPHWPQKAMGAVAYLTPPDAPWRRPPRVCPGPAVGRASCERRTLTSGVAHIASHWANKLSRDAFGGCPHPTDSRCWARTTLSTANAPGKVLVPTSSARCAPPPSFHLLRISSPGCLVSLDPRCLRPATIAHSALPPLFLALISPILAHIHLPPRTPARRTSAGL